MTTTDFANAVESLLQPHIPVASRRLDVTMRIVELLPELMEHYLGRAAKEPTEQPAA